MTFSRLFRPFWCLVGCVFLLALYGCKKQVHSKTKRLKKAIHQKTTLKKPLSKKNAYKKKGSIRLLTYNVWFSRDRIGKRLPAIFDILQRSQADVIALQEVTPWFLRALRKQSWSKTYHFSSEFASGSKQRHRGNVPGGVLILSRRRLFSADYRRLPGRMGRMVLIAKFRVGNEKWSVATVHLESLMQDGPIRAKQLAYTAPLLKNSDVSVLLGDYNFAPKREPESAYLAKFYPHFVDSWEFVHPGKPGYTWDMQKNGYAKKNSFAEEKSGRIDRVIYQGKHWKATQATLIGTQPLSKRDKRWFPSDHFGLLVTLTRKISKANKAVKVLERIQTSKGTSKKSKKKLPKK